MKIWVDIMTQYVNFVNENIEEISNLVTKNIENSRNDFKKFTLVKIKEYLDPIPTHYEWQPNDCPWDHSGELIRDGQVNLNQSIYDFLNNEYTGNCTATYISGMGFSYDTYGDDISYDTSNFAYGIMFSTTKEFIEEHFNVKLTDKQIDDIWFDCNDFDAIYDNSITNLFFYWEYTIEFLDIGQLQLIEVLNDENLGR